MNMKECSQALIEKINPSMMLYKSVFLIKSKSGEKSHINLAQYIPLSADCIKGFTAFP